MTTTTTGTRSRGLVAMGAVVGAAAGLLNLVIFFVTKAVGVPFEVTMGGATQSVPFVMPFLASFVALLLGTLLLKALARTARGVTIWTVVAAVVFVAYTGFALSAATSLATGLVLTVMHVVVVAAAFGWVVPAARRDAGA